MKRFQTGLRILNTHGNGTLIAASAAWRAGAEAQSRTTAIVAGVIIGLKAGASLAKTPWGIAIGAAAGAAVGYIAHINAHAHPAVIQQQAA